MDIGDIEPIAGAGFAMCLAYLALDRFRYRREVETAARSALATLDREGDGKPDPPPAIANNDAMRELKWMARLVCNGFSPGHIRSNAYAFFFRRKADEGAIGIFGGLAALFLLSGVASKLDRWSWMDWINQPFPLGIAFYICFACLVLPPLFVLGGRYLMFWCQERAKHLEGQLTDLLKDRVSSVQPPPLPEQPSRVSQR